MNPLRQMRWIAFVVWAVTLGGLIVWAHLGAGCTVVDDDGFEPCDVPQDCEAYGRGGERGTCGPSMVCTHDCEDDDDCEHGVCGPDEIAGVLACTPEGDR